MKLRLDPRTKLYLLLLSNLTLFFHVSLSAEIFLVGILLALFFLSDKKRSGIRLLLIYVVMVSFDFFVIPYASGAFLNFIAMFTVGIRMMLPCIISGTYAFSTTTAGEMVCGLRKLKIPETVIVPCVTVIRFFPTVAEDYRQIRNAMAFRGIAAGKLALFRHPGQSLEYILMPLLMNSNNVAQDLSVAAMTKGISLPGQHTSMIEIQMKKADWCCMAVAALPFLLFWGGILK